MASLLPFRPQVRERVECGSGLGDPFPDGVEAFLGQPHALSGCAIGGSDYVQCSCGWTCEWFSEPPIVCGAWLALSLWQAECAALYARIVRPTLEAGRREGQQVRRLLGFNE